MKHTLLNIRQFAANVARNDSGIARAAIPFAQAYKSADAAGKAQLLSDWKLGYVRETFSLNGIVVSDEQIGKGKGQTSKTYLDEKGKRVGVTQLLDRANYQFRWHVAGIKKIKKVTATTSDNTVVTRKVRAAAMEFLGAFDGDTLDKQIDAAIKALRAMK